MNTNTTRHPRTVAGSDRPQRPFAAAVLAAGLTAASVAPAVHARSGDVATDAMAERIRRALVLGVPSAADASRVTVVVEDGRYVLQGFVNGIDNHQDAMWALGSVEGLDRSLIEDRIVRQ